MSLCSGGSSDPDQAGERLKRDAEAEMGRKLPDDALYDSNKELGRYRYDAVKTLTEGTSRGYLVTCTIRRERSCLHEIREKGLIVSEKDDLGIVKISARGIVMLLESEGTGDVSILETVAKVYNREPDESIAFTRRIIPVLRTFLYKEDTFKSLLDQIGNDLAGLLVNKSSDVFECLWNKDEVKIAVMFHGRDIVSNKRLEFIHSIAKGFSDGFTPYGRTKVDLGQPDVVLTVDSLSVMGRDFVLVGICPADWCVTKPRIQLKSLASGVAKKSKREAPEEVKNEQKKKKLTE